jgi:hypothetical protein
MESGRKRPRRGGGGTGPWQDRGIEVLNGVMSPSGLTWGEEGGSVRLTFRQDTVAAQKKAQSKKPNPMTKALRTTWTGPPVSRCHGPVMAGPWPGLGPSMAGPWPGHGPAMAQPWPGHGPAMARPSSLP